MNDQTGEMEIEVLDKKYTIKPSFKGIAEMESRACPLTEMIHKVANAKLGLNDVTAIIFGGIIGKQGLVTGITYDQLGENIMKHGMGKLTPRLGEFLFAAYTGSPLNVSQEELEKKQTDSLDEKVS